MRIRRFEDLIAWQKARILTKEIYEVTRQPAFAKDYGLSGQIQRASVSIMSNIAEGYERGRTNDYHHFLVMANASCAEFRSQLYVSLDVGYLTTEQFSKLLEMAEEVGKVLGALRNSIAQFRGRP